MIHLKLFYLWLVFLWNAIAHWRGNLYKHVVLLMFHGRYVHYMDITYITWTKLWGKTIFCHCMHIFLKWYLAKLMSGLEIKQIEQVEQIGCKEPQIYSFNIIILNVTLTKLKCQKWQVNEMWVMDMLLLILPHLTTLYLLSFPDVYRDGKYNICSPNSPPLGKCPACAFKNVNFPVVPLPL